MPQRANRPYATTPEQRRQREQRFDEARRSSIRRLYSTSRWQTQRAVVTDEQPICNACHATSSSLADHVIPAEIYIATHGGDLEAFFDPSNLQGLCVSCHRKKTSREQK